MGIDPGRDKVGWAFVSRDGNLILSGIFPASEAETFFKVLSHPAGEWKERLAQWTCEWCSCVGELELEYVALGDGIGSRETMSRLVRFNLKTVLVDEEGTTLAARNLYWRLHRPVWWQRCLPRSLCFPPRGVDDLAAWGIALRSLAIPFQRIGRE